MSVFPKILPRAINGGINWTNTQFLADLKKIIIPNTYNIAAPDKVLSEYYKETNKVGDGGNANYTIVNRFKVLEQIQRDIYPPLQQYINLLNIEAWYLYRTKTWNPIMKTPGYPYESILLHPLVYTPQIKHRINILEPIPRPPIAPDDIKWSLYQTEVNDLLDFDITNGLAAIPNGVTFTNEKYPPLKTNWNNIENLSLTTSSQSSFRLFSQLLTAYKAYKALLLDNWSNNWGVTSRVESLNGSLFNNPTGDGSISGFGPGTSHILDSGNGSKSNFTLQYVIGTTISPSFQVIPRPTPAQTTINRYEKADKDSVAGIKDKAINLISIK